MKMLLCTYRVGLPKPIPKLGINLPGCGQTKVMHVVAARKAVYPVKSRILQSPGEHKMPVEPALPWRNLGK
jgi:hypothetical protein